MSDPHGETPPLDSDEPQTPMWLPALGAALFIAASVFFILNAPAGSPSATSPGAAAAETQAPAVAAPHRP